MLKQLRAITPANSSFSHGGALQKRTRFLLVALFAAGVLICPAFSQVQNAVVIQGNTPPILRSATLVGHSDPNRVLDIVVALNLHDEPALDKLVKEVQDQDSPEFRRFITPPDFLARFAPSLAEVDAVTAYLKSQGLMVIQVSSNRTLIQARGTVDRMEQAFHVSINRYTLNGEIHFSNEKDPEVPASLGGIVRSVAGMSSLARFHSAAQTQTAGAAAVQAIYTPRQIATAYNFPNINNVDHGRTTYDGAGITIAIATAFSYLSSDASVFWQYYGITRSGSVTDIAVNGGSTTSNFESTLDVEQVGAQATGANVLVYETPDTTFANMELMYNQIVTDNRAQVMSTSWVACEADTGSASVSADEAIFKQGAAQGISFFVGSGDLGAFACPSTPTVLAVDYPSSSQYFTAVGGTNLFIDSNWQITSETAWSASGGGPSTMIPQPGWQAVASVPANGMRAIADVAFTGSDATEFYVYFQGQFYGGYGTSFGGPNWAALWALGLESISGARTGSAAPSMYAIGAKDHHTYSSTFHDVVSGNNGAFNAGPGWDYPTGWGSPNGENLVTWIKKHL